MDFGEGIIVFIWYFLYKGVNMNSRFSVFCIKYDFI